MGRVETKTYHRGTKEVGRLRADCRDATRRSRRFEQIPLILFAGVTYCFKNEDCL